MALRKQPRTGLARVGRVLAWVVLGSVLACLVLPSALFLYARTDGGRERVRRLALAQARKTVPGLELGRVEGDYLHDLRLVDVTVRDREGRAAVHADVIHVRFALGPLLQRTVAIREISVEGARVLARRGADGGVNLTELVIPSATAGTPKPAASRSGPTWRVLVKRVAVQGMADVDLGDDGPRFVARAVHLVGGMRRDAAGAQAQIDALAVDLGDAGRLSLGARAATLAGEEGDRLGDWWVSLDASSVDPSAVGLGPEARFGATIAASGHGVPLAPASRGTLAVDLSQGEVAGVPIASGRIAGSSEGPRWTLARSEVQAAGVTLVASGHGEGRFLAAELQAALAGPVDVGGRGPAVRGRGQFTAGVTGTVPELVADVRGDVRGLAVGEGRAEVVRLAAATLSAHLEGPADAPRGSLRLAARGVKASAGAPRIDGATISASLARGQLRVDAAVAGPRVRGGLRARGEVTADGADVTLAALNADFATSRYRQAVSLLHPTRVRVQAGRSLQLGQTSLRGVGYLFTGEATLAALLRAAPGKGPPRGRVDVTLQRASFSGQPRVDAQARLDLAPRAAHVVLDATLSAGDARLLADATLPLADGAGALPRLARRGPVAAHIDARCVRIEDLPLVHEALAREGITGGVAKLALDVSGELAHPDVKASFDLRDVTYRNIHGLGRDSTLKTVPGLGGSLALDASAHEMRATGTLLVRRAGVLKLDARLGVDPGELLAGADPRRAALRATVDVPAFELRSLADFLDELHGVSGQLTAHGEVTGSLARPSGSVDVRVANGRADAVAFQEIVLHAKGDAGRVEGSVSVVEASGGRLSGSGKLDRAAGDRIEARLEGHALDLGFVRVFVPTLRETGGVAELAARVDGTLADPRLHGTLEIERGRVGVIGQPTFRDLRARATLEPGHAALERLEVRSGDGSLTGKGWIALQGFTPRQARFEARAHRFLVAAAGTSGTRLDGEVVVEAARRADVLAGTVRVPRAEVRLAKMPSASGGRKLQKIGQHEDVHFVDATAKAADQRQREQSLAATAAAARRPVDVDVKVRTGPIYVRNKDLDLELRSTLRVGRVPAGARAGQPTLSGGIRIVRGRINIQKQRFDFDPGDITFDGGPDLTPALNVRLARQYPDARVTISLEGTARKPVLHMSSEPPIYDQAQIVSLILTGQPGGQPSSGKGFDPTAAVTTAVLGRLADEIAPQVGLDVLRVENVETVNSEGAATGDTDTRVEVGKYISERVYLSYAHVFAAPMGANQNEAHVEYRMTRRWVVESIFGDAGVGGLDALWTYRY